MIRVHQAIELFFKLLPFVAWFVWFWATKRLDLVAVSGLCLVTMIRQRFTE
jgi:hypothetical protein